MAGEKEATMPEKAFMKALGDLETLAKGMVPAGDAQNDDLNKGQGENKNDEGDRKEGVGGSGTDNPEGGDGKDLEKGQGAPEGSEGDSFAESFMAGDEGIQKAIEVSDFLASLVDKIGQAIDGIRGMHAERLDAMEKSLAEVVQTNQTVALSFADTLKKSFQSIAERTDRQAEDLRKSVDTLNDELAKQPLHSPKSKTTVLNKSFGDGGGDGGKEMTRDDILKSLTNMFEQGDADVTSMDIIRFESGGGLPPHLVKKMVPGG